MFSFCCQLPLFANELSIICEAAGINVWTLTRLMKKQPHIRGAFPDCGKGRQKKLLSDLYEKSAVKPQEKGVISIAYEVNNYKSEWCVAQILNAIYSFDIKYGRQPVVAMLGLALHSNECEDSPATQIVQSVLRESNEVRVLIADPLLNEHPLFNLTDYRQTYDCADIVVFLTRRPEYKLLPSNEYKVILDFCGVTS